MTSIDLLTPDWPAPDNVVACSTTRQGGVSRGRWRSLNLARHVDDDPDKVAQNRLRLAAALRLPSEPMWLEQVHGTEVSRPEQVLSCADACYEDRADRVCVVMTADCLPVLLCDRGGSAVAAAHAGWRGVLAGVLERAVGSFAAPPAQLLAWLGPAIGPAAFEVGDEVRDAFVERDVAVRNCFSAHRPGHWMADIYALARRRLALAGVEQVFGGDYCTYSDEERFFSYRRDGVTGRMASLIWRHDG